MSDKDLSPESYISGSNNPAKSSIRDYGLDVENIAPDDAELEVLKEEARNDLLFYMQTCDPNYIISKVHGLIARKLMAVAEGSIRRLIITVPPRVGKPVWEEELVLMGDGSRKKLKDILVGYMVINKDGVSGRVNDVFVQGELETVKITTDSGREVFAAKDHPFLTTSGWVEAGKLEAMRHLILRLDISRLREWSWEERSFMPKYFPDGVKCVENGGIKPCRCLSVDGDSFTANDLVVHNSRCSCIEFPSWTYGKYPKKEFIISGHNTDLPVKSSRACRNRMIDVHTYHEIFETRIAAGNAGVEEWSTTNGGSYMAVGMGGGVLGRGADVFILDDIVKGFEMAHSANQLEKAWGWMWTDVFTRLSPTGAVILIMSRLSIDDPIGRMLDPKRIAKMEADNDVLASEKWEVINLPALAGQNDPLGRKPGESIFPERWSADKYRNIRATSLAYVWAAMYDGNPVVMGGNYIPVACFQIIEPNQLPEGLRWFRSWDLATRADQIHDETATVSGAMDGADNFYLRNMEHGRWNWPETRTRIKQMAVAERIIIGIEAVAGFDTAYQNVLEVLPATITCLSLGVHKDKLTRALPWIELVAKKKVFLVAGPWITDFLLQAERFDGKKDGEDDMCDSVSLVYQLCRSGGHRIMPVTINDRLTHARQMRSHRELDG